ncbi:hypothetical protein CAOG_04488 [Capsaspora owczarzaki ATCC 30864]|uniref:DNA polymerase delta subunit 3 n=1 Tax=Capsaspora owczarzaki (strain ATCC 30864) TaxID=595528 RepID=A0A0D2WRC4_CAPO3|nr:hypothetical protein CAOG_04488 [Capsaspora owczarzaki ATCC 30864]KJE93738.1 hypothetical protein CAOG_004488 [Capsaspora owczarzaki ATCC 30864]|eukprot:XP_004348316.2 hypothetical protein CAOG_04488 [Capsaspora owczarzaki ATCC 30864]
MVDQLVNFLTIEKRVITSRWLSAALGLPVTSAKSLMAEYVHKYLAKPSNVPASTAFATYLVTGTPKDVQEKVARGSGDDAAPLEMRLVHQDALADILTHFSKVKSFEVYALSPSKPLATSIVITDGESATYASSPALRNTITCSLAVPRKISQNAAQGTARPILPVKALSVKATPAPAQPSTAAAPPASSAPAEATATTPLAKKPSVGAQSSVASMFAKAKTPSTSTDSSPASKETKVAAEPMDVSPSPTAPAKAASSAIASMFAKAKPKSSEPKKEAEVAPAPAAPTAPTATAVPSPVDTPKRRRAVDSDDDEEEVRPLSKKVHHQEVKKPEVKKPQDDDEEDEDDDDEAASAERDFVFDEEPPTGSKVVANKPEAKAARVQVKRTFVDEKGFRVTKMVFEDAPADETSPPAAPAPNPAPKSPPKPAPAPKSASSNKTATATPPGSKQASLMSFFKK